MMSNDIGQDVLKALNRSKIEGEFVSSSGESLNYFYDIKGLLTHPKTVSLIGEFMAGQLVPTDSHVVGLGLGGSLLTVAMLNSPNIPNNTHGFFMPHRSKGHGLKRAIEGMNNDSIAGKEFVLIEDVVTTGNSVIEAIECIEGRFGGKVDHVIVLLGRDRRGRDRIVEKTGVNVNILFSNAEYRL